MLDMTHVRPNVEFALIVGDSPGVPLKADMVVFLREVEKRGSLNAAAKCLHVSYPRSLSTLKQLEDALGASLVQRVRPDGSRLTEDGRSLLELFERAERQTQLFSRGVIPVILREMADE